MPADFFGLLSQGFGVPFCVFECRMALRKSLTTHTNVAETRDRRDGTGPQLKLMAWIITTWDSPMIAGIARNNWHVHYRDFLSCDFWIRPSARIELQITRGLRIISPKVTHWTIALRSVLGSPAKSEDPVEYFQHIYLKSYPETVATSITTTNYKYNEKREKIFSIISLEIRFRCRTFTFAPFAEAQLQFFDCFTTRRALIVA